MPTYSFKFLQELGWMILVSGLIFFLTAFVGTEGVTDWSTWFVAVAGGTVRAMAAVLLAKLTTEGKVSLK